MANLNHCQQTITTTWCLLRMKKQKNRTLQIDRPNECNGKQKDHLNVTDTQINPVNHSRLSTIRASIKTFKQAALVPQSIVRMRNSTREMVKSKFLVVGVILGSFIALVALPDLIAGIQMFIYFLFVSRANCCHLFPQNGIHFL